MKKNTKKTKKQQIEPKPSPITITPLGVVPNPEKEPSTPPTPTVAVVNEIPPLEALLLEAQQEEDQEVVRQYARVIHVLREKHFSYQEIANWLNERGFETDRNEVYRAYSKILRPDEEEYEAHLADEEDREGM